MIQRRTVRAAPFSRGTQRGELVGGAGMEGGSAASHCREPREKRWCADFPRRDWPAGGGYRTDHFKAWDS